MVPVRVEGVRRNFTLTSVFFYTATLVEESGCRMLNIHVERHEALAIVAALHSWTLPRPQTIDLLVSTLAFHGAHLEEVRIHTFRQSPIYLAVTSLRWRDGREGIREQVVDMCPGDAIALALLMGCPLMVADDVMQAGGINLAEGDTPELHHIRRFLQRQGIVPPEGTRLRLGYSRTPMRDALVKELKVSLPGKAPMFPEEDTELRKQELLAFLLGPAHQG